MLIATIIGLTGIAVYYVSAVGFEMLSISKQYFSAESMEYKQQLLAVGQGLIARYKGTAFDVYYVFNAITLILISMTMYKSRDFKRSSATCRDFYDNSFDSRDPGTDLLITLSCPLDCLFCLDREKTHTNGKTTGLNLK
ncbi:MAG TPA: hypothetical protein PKC47_02615 [Petrimonas sp.]|nr:hypothetical protein [Petrimonas sp.]